MLTFKQTHRLAAALIPSAIALFVACSMTQSARAYTPEDPEVRAMIERGLRFIESQPEDKIKVSPYMGREAQPVLVAYAHLKYLHDHDSPLIKMGLKHALQYVDAAKKNGGQIGVPKSRTYDASVYEYSVIILFLAELDPVKYASDLQMLGNALLNLQHASGGFGYPMYETSDISQAQYVALAAWTLDHAGVNLSLDRLGRMLSWLLRVQDPSGSWPYQAKDPGPGRGLITQPREEMSVTMCLAGGSAALITGDVFKIWENTTLASKIQGLPKALKPAEKSEVVLARRKKSPVKPDDIVKSLRHMETYRGSNPYHREKGGDWYYYMLYTLERYESFFEMATGRPSNPAWYDDEVKRLMSLQDSTGAWGTKDASKSNPAVSTAFAVLFLMRSSQKAIASVSRGSMRGGYELPKDTTEIKVVDGKVVKPAVATAVTDLLNILESDGANDVDGKSIPEDLKLESDPEKRRAQLDRLSRLLRGSQSWQARRVAARLLGKSDEHGVVPTLIFALSDPDVKVRAYALDGLNFISRKFQSTAKVKDMNSAEISKLQNEWTAWYQTIDPSYVLDGSF